MRLPAGLPVTVAVAPAKEQARRDEARLAQLVRQHLRNVWCTLRHLGVPAELADDATQEVFVIAARKLGAVESGRERYFLYGITLRVAANVRRAHATQRRLFDETAAAAGVDSTPAADMLLSQKQMRAMLDAVLDALPKEQRTVFVMAEIEGWSGPEIAELLQVPLGTVASRLRRAREAFHRRAELVRARCSSGGLP